MDYAAGARIGCSTAVFGDFGFVGACDAAHGGRQAAGMVHVLRLASGTTFGRVTPPRAMAMAQFGTSIAVSEYASNGYLLVGAPGESQNNADAVGFVYLFRFPLSQSTGASSFAYSYMRQLKATDPLPNNHFGSALAMHNGRCIVGARGPSVRAPHSCLPPATFKRRDIEYRQRRAMQLRTKQRDWGDGGM